MIKLIYRLGIAGVTIRYRRFEREAYNLHVIDLEETLY
jgi:hypothetical protein